MASKHSHHHKQNQKIAPGTGYKRHDIYWAKAKDDGYAARSVYKLQEVDQAHKLLPPGAHVLDLGCAPGSWLQYAAQRVGATGRVVGVDLEAVTVPLSKNVTTLVLDMARLTTAMLPSDALPIDVVLSDLAPHTSGIRSVDQDRSFDLSARAVLAADQLLRPGGHLLVKTFQGGDTKRLGDAVRLRYTSWEFIRPQATRKVSFEVYVLGKGYKGVPSKDPLETL
jgi:23S rRNA (uridine2552-2'-O)-methyltransferase